jgi:HK97 family phage major capsid protein
MTLKEMRDRQAQIVAEARERLDLINGATDEARAKELEAAHDAAMAEHDRIEARAIREEKQAALEKRSEELRAAQRPGNGAVQARGQDEGARPDYRTAFYAMLAAGADVSELSAEHRAALRGGVAEFRAQTVGTTTAGGYTVPTELANEIVRSMLAWGPMYDPGISTEMSTASGAQINIPTVDDTTVAAAAHTEGTALTDDGSTDATFGQKSLNAYVFDTKFVKWSMELAQDSIFNVEALLGSLLGERLGRIANLRLTTGTGSSQPQGVVVGSTLGKTAAGTTAITADEIIDLVHSVNPAYRVGPKVRFMFNDSTLAAVRKLKDGQGNYLWQLGNVQAGVPGSLLGYNYSVNQAMASLTTGQKVMLFGDFSKFYVRKVGAPVLGVMRERFWPDLGIAGLIRFDGRVVDTAAIKYLITA